MAYFIGCFLAATVPFFVERFYFGKRFGPFTGLFRLFVGQVAILVVANAVMLVLAAPDSPGWLLRLKAVVTMVTNLSIGIIPLMSATAAVVSLLILALGWFTHRKAR